MRRRQVGVVALCAAMMLGTSAAGVPAGAAVVPDRQGDRISIDDDALRRMLSGEPKRRAGREDAVRDLPPPVEFQEIEPASARGHNDSPSRAEPVEGFGSRDNPRLRASGTLATPRREAVELPPNAEDDGAIPLARATGAGADRTRVTVPGRIGDGPHGSAGDKKGDYDFYRVDGSVGKTLSVDVAPRDGLIPTIALYNADGDLLIGAQDLGGNGGKAHLSYAFTDDGPFYVSVGAYLIGDPFDPASGFGVQTEGPYDATIAVDVADTDVYAVELRRGDVLGATVTGAARGLAVYDGSGRLAQGSGVDTSPILPSASPLPGGGNATLDHVVPSSGTYYVAVRDGSGRYDATIEVHRPARRATPQTIFVDFDGARFNNRVLGGVVTEPGVRTLSPLRSFLQRWGLRASDERAVIDVATRTIRENLADDLPGTRLVVRNSAEHPDTFGKPGVARLIVGGTVEEAGILPVVGVAESVDPGNFAREETALVLLDRMSGGADNPVSLNAYWGSKSDRVTAVGRAIGNVASHEAGHYSGNWHTDTMDGVSNLMDTDHLFDLYALGPDRLAGTADDVDTDLAHGRFDPLQGLSGLEDNRYRTRFAFR